MMNKDSLITQVNGFPALIKIDTTQEQPPNKSSLVQQVFSQKEKQDLHLDQISLENQKKIESMSEQEIKESLSHIYNTIDPKLIAKLKGKGLDHPPPQEMAPQKKEDQTQDDLQFIESHYPYYDQLQELMQVLYFDPEHTPFLHCPQEDRLSLYQIFTFLVQNSQNTHNKVVLQRLLGILHYCYSCLFVQHDLSLLRLHAKHISPSQFLCFFVQYNYPIRILIQNFLIKNTEESIMNIECQVLIMKMLRQSTEYQVSLFDTKSFLHPRVADDFSTQIYNTQFIEELLKMYSSVSHSRVLLQEYFYNLVHFVDLKEQMLFKLIDTLIQFNGEYTTKLLVHLCINKKGIIKGYLELNSNKMEVFLSGQQDNDSLMMLLYLLYNNDLKYYNKDYSEVHANKGIVAQLIILQRQQSSQSLYKQLLFWPERQPTLLWRNSSYSLVPISQQVQEKEFYRLDSSSLDQVVSLQNIILYRHVYKVKQDICPSVYNALLQDIKRLNHFCLLLRQHKRQREQSMKYLEFKIKLQVVDYVRPLIKLAVLCVQNNFVNDSTDSIHLAFFFQHYHLGQHFTLEANVKQRYIDSMPFKVNLNKATPHNIVAYFQSVVHSQEVLFSYDEMAVTLYLDLVRLFSKTSCLFIEQQLCPDQPRPFQDNFLILFDCLAKQLDFTRLAEILNINKAFVEQLAINFEENSFGNECFCVILSQFSRLEFCPEIRRTAWQSMSTHPALFHQALPLVPPALRAPLLLPDPSAEIVRYKNTAKKLLLQDQFLKGSLEHSLFFMMLP